MSMWQALRQMPVQTGQAGVARGEAARVPVSDEACCPRHESGNIGSALLEAVLTRENLKRAFKRVRANKGAAGGATAIAPLNACSLSLTSTGWVYLDSHNLNFSNRPVRTRMPGGVAGERPLGRPLCRLLGISVHAHLNRSRRDAVSCSSVRENLGPI